MTPAEGYWKSTKGSSGLRGSNCPPRPDCQHRRAEGREWRRREWLPGMQPRRDLASDASGRAKNRRRTCANMPCGREYGHEHGHAYGREHAHEYGPEHARCMVSDPEGLTPPGAKLYPRSAPRISSSGLTQLTGPGRENVCCGQPCGRIRRAI